AGAFGARAQVDDDADAELLADVAQVGRRQVVERVAAEEASPAHDPSVLGAVAAEVAEVEAAFELDEARARRGSTLHPRNLDGDRDDRMEPAGRSGLRH